MDDIDCGANPRPCRWAMNSSMNATETGNNRVVPTVLKMQPTCSKPAGNVLVMMAPKMHAVVCLLTAQADWRQSVSGFLLRMA